MFKRNRCTIHLLAMLFLVTAFLTPMGAFAAGLQDSETSSLSVIPQDEHDDVTPEQSDTLLAPLGDSEAFTMTDARSFGITLDGKEMPGNWFQTTTGNVAYCMEYGRGMSEYITYYNSWYTRLGYWIALLNGYPCTTNLCGYNLDEQQARAATQLTVWALAWQWDDPSIRSRTIDLNDCQTTTQEGEQVLAAAKALYAKATATPNPGTCLHVGELGAYINFLTLSGDGTIHDRGTYLQTSSYTVTSDLETADLSFSVNGFPNDWYFSDTMGNRIETPRIGTPFCFCFLKTGMTDYGRASFAIKASYRYTAALCWGVGYQSQDMQTAYDPTTLSKSVFHGFEWTNVQVAKTDGDTSEPIAGATFELYRQVDSAWDRIAQGTTSADGLLSFPVILQSGTYKVVETEPAPGYLTGEQSNRPSEKIFEVVSGEQGVCCDFTNYRFRTLRVEKRDVNSHEPLANTVYLLERKDEASASWVEYASGTTTQEGILDIGDLVFGDYRITEVCPHPSYATCEESGSQSSRTFTVDEGSPSHTQLFENKLIAILCEIDQNTIALTSAAYRSASTEEGIDNIGKERYHYTVDFRSTANVRADEFTVTDHLENVTQGYVHLTDLWTPCAWGDTDGLLNVWYQTNLTDAKRQYSTASAMASNAPNPNNPSNACRISSTGWELWQEGIDATQRAHLAVDNLNLGSNEYLTAVRWEYGSVERGFTTRNTGEWTPREDEESFCADAAQATGLHGAFYLVEATRFLVPLDTWGNETLIKGSAVVDMTRNYNPNTREGLTSNARDAVETRVISAPDFGEFPRTGDGDTRPLIVLIALLALASIVLAGGKIRSKRKDTMHEV